MKKYQLLIVCLVLLFSGALIGCATTFAPLADIPVISAYDPDALENQLEFNVLMMSNQSSIGNQLQPTIVRSMAELTEISANFFHRFSDGAGNEHRVYILAELIESIDVDFFADHVLFMTVFGTPHRGGYLHIENIRMVGNTMVIDYDLMDGPLTATGTMILVVSLDREMVERVDSLVFNQVEILYNFSPDIILLVATLSADQIIQALGDIAVLEVEYLQFANIVFVHLANPTHAIAIEAVNRLTGVVGIQLAELNHNGWGRVCINRFLELNCTCFS